MARQAAARIATKDLKLAFIKPTASVLGSPFKFEKRGQCGMELSELLPHLGTCADDICLVRSMHTEAFNHHPGQLFLFTGHMVGGRPDDGRVGHVRARQRIAEPAGVRGALLRRRNQRGIRQLLQRISALDVRRNALPQPGRSDPVLVESEGRIERRAAHAARHDSRDEPGASSRRREMPRSPRAFTPTNSHTGCRPPAPNCSTSPRNRRRRSRRMA